MPQRTIRKDLLLALPALEQRVNKAEKGLGSLTKMNRTPTASAFTFDGGATPDTKVKLVQAVNGAAVQPPGSTKICEGPLWSAGVPIDAVAYRLAPKAEDAEKED